MTSSSLRYLLATAALALSACSSAPPPPAMPQGMADARFVLLGEVHDNPHHHQLRAQWLKALLADGRPTLIVFEQMDATRNAELRDARKSSPGDAAAITRAGGLDAKAWRWPLHKPIVEAALSGGAGIAGGNLPRETISGVVRQGTVPPELKPMLDAPGWSAALQKAAEADIVQGHCGALPASQVAPMALAQRVRDASLARAMLAAAPAERVVLIAGNGHVRRDRGVPLYLRSAGIPASAILTVGLIEVDGEGDGGTSFGLYDRLQATPREPRPDPCEVFKGRS